MKTTRPSLRVSHLTYIRVMNDLLAETALLNPDEAVGLIAAVNSYLHTPAPVSVTGKSAEILRRYIDIIDRAALRSARARRAALARRQSKVESTPAPIESTETTQTTDSHTEPTSTPITPINPIGPIPPKTSRPRIKIKHKSLRPDPRRYPKKTTTPGWR